MALQLSRLEGLPARARRYDAGYAGIVFLVLDDGTCCLELRVISLAIHPAMDIGFFVSFQRDNLLEYALTINIDAISMNFESIWMVGWGGRKLWVLTEDGEGLKVTGR